MKLLLLFIFLSFSALGNEIKLHFDKTQVLVGEVLQAQVQGYKGSPIENKRIGDELYIVSLNEESAEVIFIKKLGINAANFSETEKITWSPIELKETDVPQGISLIEQYLDIGSSKIWILVLVIILVLIIIAARFYFVAYRPKALIKKQRLNEKERLFAATSFHEINDIWRSKHQLVSQFPSIEEAFLKFELEYYKIAFRPDISIEEKKSIEKAYQDFLDRIRGVNFGV